MNMQILDARQNANGQYKVDISGGERIGRAAGRTLIVQS